MCTSLAQFHLNRFLQFLLESWARVHEVAFFVVEAYHLRFFIEDLVTFLGDGLRLLTESLNNVPLEPLKAQ